MAISTSQMMGTYYAQDDIHVQPDHTGRGWIVSSLHGGKFRSSAPTQGQAIQEYKQYIGVSLSTRNVVLPLMPTPWAQAFNKPNPAFSPAPGSILKITNEYSQWHNCLVTVTKHDDSGLHVEMTVPGGGVIPYKIEPNGEAGARAYISVNETIPDPTW